MFVQRFSIAFLVLVCSSLISAHIIKLSDVKVETTTHLGVVLPPEDVTSTTNVIDTATTTSVPQFKEVLPLGSYHPDEYFRTEVVPEPKPKAEAPVVELSVNVSRGDEYFLTETTDTPKPTEVTPEVEEKSTEDSRDQEEVDDLSEDDIIRLLRHLGDRPGPLRHDTPPGIPRHNVPTSVGQLGTPYPSDHNSSSNSNERTGPFSSRVGPSPFPPRNGPVFPQFPAVPSHVPFTPQAPVVPPHIPFAQQAPVVPPQQPQQQQKQPKLPFLFPTESNHDVSQGPQQHPVGYLELNSKPLGSVSLSIPHGPFTQNFQHELPFLPQPSVSFEGPKTFNPFLQGPGFPDQPFFTPAFPGPLFHTQDQHQGSLDSPQETYYYPSNSDFYYY